MEYAKTQGSVVETIVRQALRAGQPIPDAILNAPKLLPGSAMYIDAWYDLDSERDYGMSPGRIKWSHIVNYCRFYGFDEVQTDAMIRIITEVDIAHLTKLKAQRDGGKSARPSKATRKTS